MAPLNASGGGGKYFFEFIDKLNKNSLGLLKKGVAKQSIIKSIVKL